MSAPSAKIIADSISEGALGSPPVRLTTMEVTFHRFVLAEFNTHRVFSRNSASSRAIPVHKQLAKVRDDLAYPVSWPEEQKGMQGGAKLSGGNVYASKAVWDIAARDAVMSAEALVDVGLHKSVVNRLLEPFMWHTAIITSTSWKNFFSLRLDKDAQPEIRVAAQAMKAAYDASEPSGKVVGEGLTSWHLPYILNGDKVQVSGGLTKLPVILAKVSAARCARVSYLTQDGVRDIAEDLQLYDRLVTDRVAAGLPVHWSPLEHVATPWPKNHQLDSLEFRPLDGDSAEITLDHLPATGNLLNWRSLRTEVEAIRKVRTFS